MSAQLSDSKKDNLIKDIVDQISYDEDENMILRLIGKKDGIQDDALFRYDEFTYLLYSTKEFGISHKLRELKFAIPRGEGAFGTFGLPFFNIFKELKLEEKASFKDFEEKFDRMLAEIKSQHPLTKFALVYPLNVQIERQQSLKVGKNSFDLLPFDDFKSTFLDNVKDTYISTESGVVASSSRLKDVCSDQFSYLTMDIYSRNTLFARQFATEIVQSLLGLLVLASQLSSDNPYVHLERTPTISKLELNYILVFSSNKLVEIDFLMPERQPEFEDPLSGDDLKLFSELLICYNSIKDPDIKKVISEALIPYYWASIDREVADSCFKYWICVESLLFDATRGGKEIKTILKNLPFLKNEPHVALKIDDLYNRRNLYAHEYKTDIHVIQQHLARILANKLIAFLLKEHSLFASKRELNKYYHLIQKQSETLQTNYASNRRARNQ